MIHKSCQVTRPWLVTWDFCITCDFQNPILTFPAHSIFKILWVTIWSTTQCSRWKLNYGHCEIVRWNTKCCFQNCLVPLKKSEPLWKKYFPPHDPSFDDFCSSGNNHVLLQCKTGPTSDTHCTVSSSLFILKEYFFQLSPLEAILSTMAKFQKYPFVNEINGIWTLSGNLS